MTWTTITWPGQTITDQSCGHKEAPPPEGRLVPHGLGNHPHHMPSLALLVVRHGIMRSCPLVPNNDRTTDLGSRDSREGY